VEGGSGTGGAPARRCLRPAQTGRERCPRERIRSSPIPASGAKELARYDVGRWRLPGDGVFARLSRDTERVARRKLVSLTVAVAALALLAAASFGSAASRPTGHLKLRLNPCCSTLPVRPGEPPPHYGSRTVRLKDMEGRTVVKQKVPMGQWTEVAAPPGRYGVVSRGCSSAQVRVTRHTEPRVRLRCPVA
jgi:hypothetical protein